ncbi:M28 family peptidase [Marinactinospora thermotolerans]|uniref:Predicted aminopeptidases n=1 Tax=Marinactinospora thermotolerans DSM 45154 TaxID=1122192 RepID=A0A1T4KJ29_9ACTN|nr:M28 family peptidase [Marinactinospora thermotolerans]SJZ42363.1 Predicted aminopeptidases [Marinactinospora thermotolerans DSM 45154]
MPPIAKALTGVGLPLALVAGAAAAIRAMRPPAPVTAEAPPDHFSAERAQRHLHTIAREPRPTGSPAAEKARAYLVEELTRAGFDVHVQETVAAEGYGRMPYGPANLAAGKIHNIVARLPGTSPGGKAVLLTSHYDSVAQGPGASDAGVPAAALVEVARALQSRGPGRNDVVIALTDGEELGLLGAKALFEEEPLARRVGAMLNFEARGTSGPVLMFETGSGEADLVAALTRSGLPHFVDSLFGEVYRRIPNSTDFAVARAWGIPGLNFAHIGDFAYYHTRLDDIEHVDPASLQHHGELALALAERLRNTDLSALEERESAYFTVANGVTLSYPRWAAGPLAAAAAALWAGALARWMRRSGISPRDLLRGQAALWGRLAGGALAAQGLVSLLGRVRPEFRRHGDFYRSEELFATLGLLSMAGAATRRPGLDELRMASAAVPLAAAALGCARWLPGAAHLPALPLVGSGIALLTATSPRSSVRLLGQVAAAVPAVALLAPRAALTYQGLTPRIAVPAMALLQLGGELAGPLMWRQTGKRTRRLLLGTCLTAAGALALRQFRLARPTPDRPHPYALMYLVDTDRRRAFWLSTDDAPGEATRPFLGDRPGKGPLDVYFPGWNRDLLHAPAALLELPPPVLDVVSEKTHEHGRRVVVDVSSPRGARQISLAVRSGAVRSWSLVGGPASVPTSPADDGPWELWLHAVPAEGFRLVLELTREPVLLRVADRSDGLPNPAGDDRFPTPAGNPAHTPAACLDVEGWSNGTLAVTEKTL